MTFAPVSLIDAWATYLLFPHLARLRTISLAASPWAASNGEYFSLSRQDLNALMEGGESGMSVLARSQLSTDGRVARVLCVECYSRDLKVDPHTEALLASPNSLSMEYSQYPRKVTITTLGLGSHGHLVIGVRDYNYLITSLWIGPRIYHGPGVVSKAYPASTTTRIMVPEDQLESFLDPPFRYAQVRSSFNHPTTYSLRRMGVAGYNGLAQLPQSIFTLSRLKEGKLGVFSKIEHRWRKEKSVSSCVDCV